MQTTTVLVPARDTAHGLEGLGGTGKTSLAATLAYECHAVQAAHLVLWVTATGRDAVVTGYAQALRDLGEGPYQGESPEHAADRFLDWLKRPDLPWLVVLDDVADPAVADGLWPAGPAGRVLVTTANPDAAAAPDPWLTRPMCAPRWATSAGQASSPSMTEARHGRCSFMSRCRP